MTAGEFLVRGLITDAVLIVGVYVVTRWRNR